MSSSKINQLAAKYKQYKENKKTPSRLSCVCSKLLSKAEIAWRKIVPISFRGAMDEFEELESICMQVTGKVCSANIYKKSLHQALQIKEISNKSTLNNKTPSNPNQTQVNIRSINEIQQEHSFVVGFTYCNESLATIMPFLSHLPQKYILVPLHLQSQTYERHFQPKIGYADCCLLLLWKGLFDQIIVLKKLKLNEWRQEDVAKEFTQRMAMQVSVKHISSQ